MRRSLRLFLTTLTTVIFTRCTPLVNMMSFFPERSAVDHGHLPDNCSVFFINAEKNVQLESWYLPCSTSLKLIIFFHGNAGHIRQRLPDLQQLRRIGINVLGFSYRGYGASSGRPSETGIYRDSDAVFQYASDSLGFKVDHIYLMGRSIGTTAALTTARQKRLAGVILVTPLSSGKEHAHFHGIGWLSWFAGNCFDNLTKAEELKAPALIIHGTSDETVAYEHGRKLYGVIPTQKRFVAIEGGFHNNLEYVDPEKYWGAIEVFIGGR